MSESLAEKFNLKKIDLNEFIHKFVKPIIKENLILKKENEEKDKQIDLMTEYISKIDIEEEVCMKNKTNPEWCNEDYTNCKNCIKQYFEKLAKEKGE